MGAVTPKQWPLRNTNVGFKAKKKKKTFEIYLGQNFVSQNVFNLL